MYQSDSRQKPPGFRLAFCPPPPVTDLYPAIFTVEIGHQRIDAPGFIIGEVVKRQGADPAGTGKRTVCEAPLKGSEMFWCYFPAATSATPDIHQQAIQAQP
jgi:hypothetical protein